METETATDDARYDEASTDSEAGTLGGYNTQPAAPIDVDDEFADDDLIAPGVKPLVAAEDPDLLDEPVGETPVEPPAPEEKDDDDGGDQKPVEPPKTDETPKAKKPNARSKNKKSTTTEAKKKESGAPVRTYIVFEEFEMDPEGKGYQEVHRVEARNAENAIRRAYKELAGDKDEASATLVVVPESMWRPTPVHLKPRTTVSVSIG